MNKNKIRIAHEAPLSIFDEVNSLTAYSYCLVHLMDESQEYREKFVELCKGKHEVILDNSIFELGTAFKGEDYFKWVEKLKPTWYIIPDVLEECDATIQQAEEWLFKYADKIPKESKSIGVVQGKTLEEVIRCYQALDRLGVDMIAISFDYSLYEKMFPHPNQKVSWMMGRVQLLGILLEEGIIKTDKPHHLLGSALPIEGKFYGQYNWIYSTDTSNPVVHAIKGIKYQENFGLYHKESQKLHEMIHYPEEEIDMDLVTWNIQEFKKYWQQDGL